MKENLQARLMWFANRLRTMKYFNSRGLTYIDSDLASAAFNPVWGVPKDFEEVSQVTTYYFGRDLPATWWLPVDVCSPAAWWLAEHAWNVEDLLIGLVWRPDSETETAFEAPPGLDIRPCLSPERVRDMGRILDAVIPREHPRADGLVAEIYERAAPAILDGGDGLSSWVAYVDDRPAATLSMLRIGRRAGLYDLATVPEFRHKRYALTLFEHALAQARAAGCELVTVQTAARGVRLYINRGFIPVSQFVLWHNRAAR